MSDCASATVIPIAVEVIALATSFKTSRGATPALKVQVHTFRLSTNRVDSIKRVVFLLLKVKLMNEITSWHTVYTATHTDALLAYYFVDCLTDLILR